MLFPYQIGNTPLFRYLVGSDDPIQFSLEQSWDVPSIRFSQSGGMIYQGPVANSLAQVTELTIEGIVQVKTSALAQELLSSLRSLGGRLYTPIIVFRYEDPLEGTDPPLIDWLVADAVITSNSAPYAYAGMDLGEASHVRLRLDISINLMSPFRRMSPWFWEYRRYQDRAQNPYVADGASSPSIRFIHPKSLSEIEDQFYFLRWQDPDTLTNPDFWEIAHSEGIYGGEGMEFAEVYEVFYNSDISRWAAPPQVVYAFTELLPYGTLTIEVQRSTGSFYNDDFLETSILDLEILDTDMAAAGYGGLSLSDIVYVGNVFPFPSYVLRNGEILASLTPIWDYSGLYPGELQTGPARVRFSPYLTSMKVAYHFEYGIF